MQEIKLPLELDLRKVPYRASPTPSPKRLLPPEREYNELLKPVFKEIVKMSQESRNSSQSRANSGTRDPMSVVLQARKNAKLHHFNKVSAYNKKIEDYFQHHSVMKHS